MRRLLLALPFALLPLAIAHAADAGHEVEHASLGAHEHGTARLNAALDEQTLELELDSPAMNLVGFEHPATSDADKAAVAQARAQLEQPLTLFSLPVAARCIVAKQELHSPLFGDKPEPGEAADHDDDDHDHDATAGKGHDHAAKSGEHHHEHSEIHAHYQFQCDNAAAIKQLDLARLFKIFPATHKVQIQLVAPSGQQGLEATPANSALNF
jgi:hypothetical protein